MQKGRSAVRPTGLAWQRSAAGIVLLGLIAVSFLIRLHLVFVYEVNWDEFLNLSMVYQHARGELHEVLQTIFVHGFGWVGIVSTNEVDQVIAARLMIYALGLGTATFLYLTSRRFMPTSAALFAVLCYLTFTFVLRQGNSLRTDQMAAFTLMFALWLIVRGPRRPPAAALAGLLIGLAGMITIKSIFYMPTVAVILLIRLLAAERRRPELFHGLAVAGAALLSFAGFYLLHRLTFADPASTLAFLERTTGKTLVEPDFSNAVATFQVALLQNPVFWLASLGGFLSCIVQLARSGGRDADRLTMLAFAAPLGSLLVYSESHVYFYPFILPPVAVLCGAGYASLRGSAGRGVATAAPILLAVTLGLQYVSCLKQDNAFQRETLEVVHRAFPEATAYIDRTSMVSAYPKRGFFMSVWGMTDYYRQGRPVMRDVLERDQPRFLLANRRMLDLDDLAPDEHGPEHAGLFKADVAILRQNFIRHWGPLYVAGKRIALPAAPSSAPSSASVEILVAGRYTLEANAPVRLNGAQVEPGDTVGLAQGRHRLEATTASPAEVVLRWGDHLYSPARPAPVRPLFTEF